MPRQRDEIMVPSEHHWEHAAKKVVVDGSNIANHSFLVLAAVVIPLTTPTGGVLRTAG